MSRQFVALIRNQDVGQQGEPWDVLRLPDPHTGEPRLYMLSSDELLEVSRIQSGERSWFVGNSVQEDGSLLLFTPVDPLFILLPILDAARRQTAGSKGLFRSLHDIVEDCVDGVHPEDLLLLMEMPTALDRFRSVCNVQDSNTGELVYRLDDERVTAWIRKKVDAIASAFSETKALSRKLLKYSPAPLEDPRIKELVQQQIAVRIVAEYLTETWSARLSALFDFSDVEKLETMPVPGYLMHESEGGEQIHGKRPSFLLESNAKKNKSTPGQQKLANANIKGMRPMDSFFAKKQKENISS